jgi:alpha-galactosidase
LINYTNPMAMLTWVHSVGSTVRNVGLCHSVQGTTRRLAEAVGAPYDEVSYDVAGINHQAWVLGLRHHTPEGIEDLYPRLRAALDTHESFEKDRVRVEVMKQFGYFVTESTRHMSEYLPYFRRTQELLDDYGLIRRPIETDPDKIQKREWEKDTGVTLDEDAEVPPLKRSHEYASAIIEASRTGVPLGFHGNVMNRGSIDNLPQRCCVEVPCVADRAGVRACRVGELPPQCAAMNMSSIAVQELAVRAVLDRDREAAFHAVALDPLTASVASLPRIREMFEEMWQAEGDLLSHFNA